ncbi:MAG: hypothetical protein AVDCRST_MAG64-3927, partial [uncultured Phycisphaerae bacterium]
EDILTAVQQREPRRPAPRPSHFGPFLRRPGL